MKYRKYRRMTEEEQKATGYPTDYESMREGVSPIEIELGFDPFLTYDDIEADTIFPLKTINCSTCGESISEEEIYTDWYYCSKCDLDYAL